MPSPKSETKPRFKFEAIGTVWDIEVYDPLSPKATGKLSAAIQARIAAFDKDYSRFRADSLITSISQKAGTYRLPPDAKPMVNLYRQLYDLTDGLMTPLIGQTLVEAGYDANYSLKTGTLHQPPAWEEVLDYSFPNLTTRLPALLDFGAAGKGYLIDLVSELIKDSGVWAFCVDAGGDMVFYGREKLEVALENPDDASEAVGVAKIQNQALCGSSGNRRTWGKFHHIIDPHSLASPRHIRALWVTADSCLLADGLATALFFAPAIKLREQYTFEYAIIYEDRRLEKSDHFPASFFID